VWANFLSTHFLANKQNTGPRKHATATTKQIEFKRWFDTKLLNHPAAVSWAAHQTDHRPRTSFWRTQFSCSLSTQSSTHCSLILPNWWFKLAMGDVLMTRIFFLFTPVMTHAKKSNELCLLSLPTVTRACGPTWNREGQMRLITVSWSTYITSHHTNCTYCRPTKLQQCISYRNQTKIYRAVAIFLFFLSWKVVYILKYIPV
jgi:hypothetical protein